MIRVLPTFLAAALSVAPALAEDPIGTPATLELLAGWRSDDGTHMAALRVTLAEGWKTYWRAPGDAGIPPVFDWSGSDNLAEVRFHWPVPEVMRSNGLTTLVYSHELILPMEMIPADPDAPIRVHAGVRMGVCHDICLPFETSFSGDLPSGGGEDSRITAALAQRPDTADEAGLITAHCVLEPIADGMRVIASLDLPTIGTDEHVVIEPASADVWASEAMTRRDDGILTATVDMVPPDTQDFDLDTRQLRLTVLADGRAVDIQGCDLAP
jgi:DsbC/DsbD-like thiol-disulfide interchange protein